jgi:tRNA (guanine37-N1)-methyltransferase
MRFDIVTIFPRMIEAALGEGILARAIQRNVLAVRARDLREFTEDRHRTVDDVPYGGGPGMVLKPEPLFKAVDAIPTGGTRTRGDPLRPIRRDRRPRAGEPGD